MGGALVVKQMVGKADISWGQCVRLPECLEESDGDVLIWMKCA